MGVTKKSNGQQTNGRSNATAERRTANEPSDDHQKSSSHPLTGFLSGDEPIGDTYSDQEIADWFKDEEEGYSGLLNTTYAAAKENYEYHCLNEYHAFRRLPLSKFYKHAVGFGAALGFELEPVAERCERLTIVDPSKSFRTTTIRGTPVNYIRPTPRGDLGEIATESVDLITCLGVLHHIPNISFVFGELNRILMPGGYILLREPIISMGDWRFERPGLTKRERGLPLNWLRNLLKSNNVDIVSERFCQGPWSNVLSQIIPSTQSAQEVAARLDAVLCRLFLRNYTYHAETWWRKLRPRSVFYVLRKRH